MATLNILSYKQSNKGGQTILNIETVGNHGLKVDYVFLQILGAVDNKYNGSFKFNITGGNTLEYRQEKYTPSSINTNPTLVIGTIIATIIDYITLTGEVLNANTNLYTISSVGNYQILLDIDKFYRVDYKPYNFKDTLIGNRTNDDDDILYAQITAQPIAIYKAKWFIVEVKNFYQTLELRLTKLN